MEGDVKLGRAYKLGRAQEWLAMAVRSHVRWQLDVPGSIRIGSRHRPAYQGAIRFCDVLT